MINPQDPKYFDCCEHCEVTTPHDILWKSLGLPHTTPCRKCLLKELLGE